MGITPQNSEQTIDLLALSIGRQSMPSDAISNTELTTFRRCQREHYFRYVLRRISPVVEEPLRFGKVYDNAQNAWWEGRDWLSVILRDACDGFEAAKATAMMCGYDAMWKSQNLEPLGTQLAFTTLIDGVAVKGIIDNIARDTATGELVVVERKSSAEDIGDGSNYWRRVRAMDPQVTMYMPGARSLGFDVSRCEYDVSRKPGQKPKKATPIASRRYAKRTGELDKRQRETDETAEEYFDRLTEAIEENPAKHFARHSLVRLESEEEEHAQDVVHIAEMIVEARRKNRHPRNPSACQRYGRMCPYFAVCEGTASIEDFELRTDDNSVFEEPKERDI